MMSGSGLFYAAQLKNQVVFENKKCRWGLFSRQMLKNSLHAGYVRRRMSAMKHFLYLMPLALCPLAAQTVDAKAACMAALDAVRSSQSDNFAPAVRAVMEATGGDEQAYWRLMKEAADAGHPVALVWLAQQNLQQLKEQRLDPETAPEAITARTAMEQAAQAGYLPGLVGMAHLTGSGIGAPMNENEGMKYLMEACKRNSARARAAYLLLTGRLEEEGATGSAVAAELNRQNYFVEEFLSGLTAKSDEEKSREWLTAAATHGSPSAAGALARYYLMQGKDALGHEFLQQAVARDHAESMALMASFLLPGADISPALQKIIKPDQEAAIRLFREAVLLGYTPALIPLAGEYHKQPEKYSAERIFELYRRAADCGDPRGGVAYAYCLVTGRGCTPDVERGIRILNQLVDAGVAFANLALADVYFNGSGVEADMRKAISALNTAASAGVPQSYTLMAVISQLGNANKASDPSRARVYLRMAAERGERDPQQSFDEMVKAGGWKFIP